MLHSRRLLAVKAVLSQATRVMGKRDTITHLTSTGEVISTSSTLTDLATLKKYAHSLFLPTGFPNSVEPYYARYAGLTFIQVALNNVNRTLATQAMLLSVGAGSAGLPIAAAINWVLKDGIGQLGSIVVSSLINRNFDSDPKRYRFQAVALGQVSNLLSILSLSYPPAFLALTSISSTLSRIGTVAHLSSRVRIYDNMAREENVGDIMRCSQAQSTAASILGTAVGVVLAPVVLSSPSTILAVFTPLAVATQWLAYRSSCVVVSSTFNLQRAELIFDRVILNGQFLTPAEVSEIETFVFPYSTRIIVNPPMTSDLALKIGDLQTNKFATLGDVKVWISSEATAEDAVRAVYSALHGDLDAWQHVRNRLTSLGWMFDVSFIDDERARITIL